MNTKKAVFTLNLKTNKIKPERTDQKDGQLVNGNNKVR